MMTMRATTLLCSAAMLALAAFPLPSDAHGSSRGDSARLRTAPAAAASGHRSRDTHRHHHRHHHVAPRVVVVPRVVAAYVPPRYVAPAVVYVPATMYAPPPTHESIPAPPPVAPPAETGWFSIGGPFLAVDGASFVAGGITYALSGIRAFDPASPHGAAARARLQQLLNSGRVQVWRIAYDAYGRAIARVIVNGADLSQVMRNEGFARV